MYTVVKVKDDKKVKAGKPAKSPKKVTFMSKADEVDFDQIVHMVQQHQQEREAAKRDAIQVVQKAKSTHQTTHDQAKSTQVAQLLSMLNMLPVQEQFEIKLAIAKRKERVKTSDQQDHQQIQTRIRHDALKNMERLQELIDNLKNPQSVRKTSVNKPSRKSVILKEMGYASDDLVLATLDQNSKVNYKKVM